MCKLKEMPAYQVSPLCVTIYDSYKIHKWNMREVLKRINKERTTETIVFERSYFSLKMGWIAHNCLYNFHIKRSQTKDVDLDNPPDYPEWLYIVCGFISWIFVW